MFTLLHGIAGEDKGGLGQVHLARQRLHLRGAEAGSVGKDRKLVAFQWTLREDIDEGVVKHERSLAGGRSC